MIVVPPGFVDKRVARNGEAGRRWIDALPELVGKLCARWGVDLAGDPPRYGDNNLA